MCVCVLCFQSLLHSCDFNLFAVRCIHVSFGIQHFVMSPIRISLNTLVDALEHCVQPLWKFSHLVGLNLFVTFNAPTCAFELCMLLSWLIEFLVNRVKQMTNVCDSCLEGFCAVSQLGLQLCFALFLAASSCCFVCEERNVSANGLYNQNLVAPRLTFESNVEKVQRERALLRVKSLMHLPSDATTALTVHMVGCHWWGAMVGCHGRVPLQGGMVRCHWWGAMVGCHGRVPLLDAIAGCHGRVPW